MMGEAGGAATESGTGAGSVLLTWHGTFLFNDPRHDWIMHRGPGSLPDQSLILLHEREGREGEVTLVRARTRPRVLPAFRLDPRGPQRYNLCCTRHEAGEAQSGRYLCAIPGGTLEINREQVSDWEEFMLLPWEQYTRLSRLLDHGGIRVGDYPPLRAALGDGMVLTTGAHVIDLRDALAALSGPSSEPQVTTTAGETATLIPG